MSLKILGSAPLHLTYDGDRLNQATEFVVDEVGFLSQGIKGGVESGKQLRL